MFGWGKRRARERVKDGDGSVLRPFRWWHGFYRTRFALDRTLDDGRQETYVVDVDLVDWDLKSEFHRDGRQIATAKLPAAYPVDGGEIEVAASTFGMKRMHLVEVDGQVTPLRPVRWTAEHMRAAFGHRFPTTSRLIGWAAIVLLLAGLVVAVPAALEWITGIEVVAERVGAFTSPINPPSWLTTFLAIGSKCEDINFTMLAWV